MPSPRFSGHESFPCRYAWLPKAYDALTRDEQALSKDDAAMVALGVGKNMVRAIRFWVQATGVATLSKRKNLVLTPFGCAVFSPGGMDPYLEDIRTLWLIHWNISTHVDEPLFAWDFLLNSWQHSEIVRPKVLAAFDEEARRLGRTLSAVTLAQHFDVFLHTYVPTRGAKGDVQEDNLDCPLVELELVRRVGERKSAASSRREAIYAFRREEKPEITGALFAYFLEDYWQKRHPKEQTLSFREISVGHGSPGMVLKLPEQDIRERLDRLLLDTGGALEYMESLMQQQVVRRAPCPDLLLSAFGHEVVHAK